MHNKTNERVHRIRSKVLAGKAAVTPFRLPIRLKGRACSLRGSWPRWTRSPCRPPTACPSHGAGARCSTSSAAKPSSARSGGALAGAGLATRTGDWDQPPHPHGASQDGGERQMACAFRLMPAYVGVHGTPNGLNRVLRHQEATP
jgi:hypothetical protein